MRLADSGWLATRKISGLSSGEGLIEAVADPAPAQDGGPTVGGVADKRLFVVEQEFSRVLKVAGRDGAIVSEVLRQAWDEDNLATMTRKPLKATGAHIGVVGHITVAELRQRLTSKIGRASCRERV